MEVVHIATGVDHTEAVHIATGVDYMVAVVVVVLVSAECIAR